MIDSKIAYCHQKDFVKFCVFLSPFIVTETFTDLLDTLNEKFLFRRTLFDSLRIILVKVFLHKLLNKCIDLTKT